MSARLNFNAIRYESWKGRTFQQITSTIQKNQTSEETSVSNMFRTPPLKIYRREIASTSASNPIKTCNPRTSISIDGINQPGGSIVGTNIINNETDAYGLVNTVDFNLTSNLYERPGTCNVALSDSTCMNQETNARNRVRSSGMIRRKYDESRNNDTYYTSAKQYLVSRNRTFLQNQYNFIKQGDATNKPGTSNTFQNVYATNTPNHCPEFSLPHGTSFEYQWLDSLYYTVDVPAGNYIVEDLTQVLQNVMIQNGHYYVHNATQTKVFLIQFVYANLSDKIEIQSKKTDRFTYDTVTSGAPYSYSPNADWRTPDYSIAPLIVVLDNVFQQMIGFTAGNYPSQIIRYAPGSTEGKTYQYFDGNSYQVPAYTSDQYMQSNIFAGLQRNYVPVYYKPNNAQFAQQGGVTSSSRITRLKYDTMTNNGAKYQQAYGNNVANAMAYGVSDSVYSIKDKIGYPLTCTPVFDRYTGELKKCMK